MFKHYFFISYYVSLNSPQSATATGTVGTIIKDESPNYYLPRDKIKDLIQNEILTSAPNVVFTKESIVIMGISKMNEEEALFFKDKEN